jgi:Patatin-like phospholipase
MATWRETLEPYNEGLSRPLFDAAFLTAWGPQPWEPTTEDSRAAALLHNQLISRISLQPLSYSAGTERAALTSVFQLFQKTRDLVEGNYKCALFERLAWHLLNEHVRPFTAKWHRRSEEGALEALDTTDEFRHELDLLRPRLAAFANLLLEIRDREPPSVKWRAEDGNAESRRLIAGEIARPLDFGILLDNVGRPVVGTAGAVPVSAAEIRASELEWVERRRQHYASFGAPAGRPEADAVGLALSGGGIRSATFSLGVLMALARRNILPQVDYLSTVSGGGYLGAFLINFLSASVAAPAPAVAASVSAPRPAVATPAGDSTTLPSVGLRRDQLPFRRERGEPDALRRLRHNSRYLQTGSLWGRLEVAFAQAYGVFLNLLTLAVVVALVAATDVLLNKLSDEIWQAVVIGCVAVLVIAAVLLPFCVQRWPARRQTADSVITAIALVLLALLVRAALQQLHVAIGQNAQRVGSWMLLFLFVVILLVVVIGRVFGRGGIVWLALGAVATVLLLLTGEVVLYAILDNGHWWIELAVAVAGVVTYIGVDVNWGSLHRHYRDRLAAAFLLRHNGCGDIETAAPKKLSALLHDEHSTLPYPLINAALNVPATKNTQMQGRLTDFFLFSPFCCGSPLTGYYATSRWETADPSLDLATAMATSGAAASPQMGLRTSPVLSFWMALFNVRLGYWLANPVRRQFAPPSGFRLLDEMFGRMNEEGRHLFLSDGGHIENLGVFELLRRRCKFIVAVDGEQDPRMTFHAITNLQRLAYIDFGIEIDISLDDLRLGPRGLSRSHFIFCRIKYPLGGTRGRGGWEIGYLLYMKLSLTGNESEYLKRYKLDEPDFPHHSTANQFFTEPQFEAYRALGEHVGDKLFLGAIVGTRIATADDVSVPKWFEALAQSLLQPLVPAEFFSEAATPDAMPP